MTKAERLGVYVALQPRLELAAEQLRVGNRATGKEQLAAVWQDARNMGAGWYEHTASALATRERVSLPVDDETVGPMQRLTPREKEVLELLIGGATDKEIAEALVISPRTASVHVSNIIGKLEVTNRGSAVAFVRRDNR